jgi:glycosyltransferase involved in cell wall biosynthesis
MPEVLSDSHAGFVCPKDDPKSFAEAIINILANRAFASELGRNGRKAYELRFTADAMACKYKRLLE